MFTFLRVPWAKTCLQVVNVAKDRLTSIEAETERSVSTNEVADALEKGFEKAFAIKFENAHLTPMELQLADSLYKQKYTVESWNFSGHS
jgi:lipoate-protein ligase A